MKGSNNIEDLFKEKFRNFEADVNPKVWTNVQSGMKAASGGAGSSIAKFTIGKIFAGAAGIAAVAGSVWYFSHNTNALQAPSAVQPKTEIVSNATTENNDENNTSSNSLSDAPANKQTASAFKSTATNVSQNNSSAESTVHSSDENADNTAGTESSDNAPQQHKYGNSPKGPSGMSRGEGKTNGTNSSSKPNESATEQVQEPEAPTADIIVASSSGDVPLTLTFVNRGPATSSLTWDFADGTSSKENYPTHTFTKPGNYEVTLTAKNSAGTATDKKMIEVRAISFLTSQDSMATIFTPNGDNRYDYFTCQMKNIVSVEVVIADLKGNVVYTSSSLEWKWDGKLPNGEDAPAALYFYTIQARGVDGLPYARKGNITISR